MIFDSVPALIWYKDRDNRIIRLNRAAAQSGGKSVEELELSERPRNCLKRARVDTIGQLVQKTEDDLLAITNFGSKSLDEVVQKLDERGLSLRVKE